MTLTPQQWIAITIGMLSFLGGASAQLTQLFGPTVAADVASTVALLAGMLSVPLTVLTGQSAQVKAVQAMPGVEAITINKNASPTLAAIAVDPSNAKVDAVPSDKAAVSAIAKGA